MKPYEGMTAVLYARVSTDDKGQNPKQQLEDMKAWCKAQGVDIIAQYVDEGKTGANMDRPGMLQVMGRVMLGGVGMVLAQHPDRISRNSSDAEAFRKQLKSVGTILRFTMMDIDMDTLGGRVTHSVSNQLSEQWLIDHSLKVRKGLNYARTHGTKSGKAIGRPKVNVDIALVMECAERGYTYTQTARILGINRTTLRTHLVRSDLWEDYNALRQKALMTETTDSLYTKAEESGE